MDSSPQHDHATFDAQAANVITNPLKIAATAA